MRSRFLLVTALGFLTLPAAAQSRPGPAYFLRHPGSEPRWGRALPAGPVPTPAPLAAAPIPTVRAAAVYAPLASASQLVPPVSTQEPGRRRDLTGVFAYPPYDSYQNLPEFYRKHTLPDVYTEPLFLQLLRSAANQPRFGPR